MPIKVTTDKAENWLASILKAKDERVHLWLTKQGWRSKGNGGTYTLLVYEVEGGLGISCQCPGWGYRGYCKHAVRLAMRLARRGETIWLD